MLKNKLRLFITKNDTEQEHWFDALTIQADGEVLKILFPHSYFGRWFFTNKQELFEQAVKRCFDGMFTVIEYGNIDFVTEDKETLRRELPNTLPARSQTLESYLYNDKNSFALGIIEQICSQIPGSLYSPLLLCGESGTGKTHLLQAIAEKYKRRNYQSYIVYHPNDLAQRSIFLRPQDFWQQYSALFIDDIQDLELLPTEQKTLIHCMDACDRNRQIVFASSKPLTQLKLDDRLLARLTAGLSLNLEEPDLEVRLAYLHKLCAIKNIVLPKKLMLLLAQHCPKYRQLQGTLLRIAAHASIKKKAITQEDISAIIAQTARTKEITSHDILGNVAKIMNVSIQDILGSHRQYNLVLARQLAMYACRTSLGLSYPELGRLFGGKDHSTVIHAIRKIEKLLLTDRDINKLLTQIKMSL